MTDLPVIVANLAILALGLIFVPLVITVVIEMIVGAAFGVGSDGIRAIALVSCVTNPFMNVLLSVSYAFALGFRVSGPGTYYPGIYDIPSYSPTPAWYVMLAVAEVAVVFVEWRLLAWALGTRISSRRLLILSVIMNAASAAAGVFWPFLPYVVAAAGLVAFVVFLVRKFRPTASVVSSEPALPADSGDVVE